jgi:hypothetical protein
MVGNALRRILQRCPLPLHCGANGFLVKIDKPHNEIVWVLRLDVELGKHVCWEIGQVECHDHIRAGSNRGGEHVPVVGVWQRQSLDQVLVAGDEAVPNPGVHQQPCSLELLRLDVGAVSQNVPDPLVVDLISPLGVEQIGQRQPHQ